MADERNNATTSFPRPLLFRSFPRPIAAIAEGRTLCKGVQRSAPAWAARKQKKTSLRKPKERGQEEEEKSERPDKSKRFVFLIFLFFSSHTPVVHLPSVFEFYERKAPRRALRLICLLCAKLQSSGKSVSFEPSSRASCSRSLLGFISFPLAAIKFPVKETISRPRGGEKKGRAQAKRGTKRFENAGHGDGNGEKNTKRESSSRGGLTRGEGGGEGWGVGEGGAANATQSRSRK